MAAVPTPAQGFANTPAPLNGTTGGAAAVAHTSIPVRSQTPLIVGATVVTLALAAGIAFFVLKGGAPAAPSPAAADKPLATAAPAPKAEVAEPKVEVVPVPKEEPAAEPAPKEPSEGLGVAGLGLAASGTPSVEGVGKRPPTVVKKAPVASTPAAPKKPGDKPASTPRPRMDFGF